MADGAWARDHESVSVAVWEAALASLRRQNQDLQNFVKPVVHHAIEFAQMGDAETRKRLSILYRPKTREQIEAIRIRMNQTVRHREEVLAPPAGPPAPPPNESAQSCRRQP